MYRHSSKALGCNSLSFLRMQLQSVTAAPIGRVRFYRAGVETPIEWIGRELFHPDQWHMQALTGFLSGIHEHTLLPWDWTVVAGALLLRSLIATPFHIYSERNHAKVVFVSLDCARNRPLLRERLLKESPAFTQLPPDKAAQYEAKVVRLGGGVCMTVSHLIVLLGENGVLGDLRTE